MEKVTFTLVFILWATLGLFAQRGGGHSNHSNNNNTYHHQNTGGQAQFGSMMTLNTGNNSGGLRPNGNVGNPSTQNGAHHNHNHNHNHNTGHNHNHNQGQNHHACTHGHSCTFGCTSNHYVHVPVHITAFSGWLHSLERQCNSAARMSMALDYVEHNWLTTHQIYDILTLFSNQSSMLMIAERAYPNTCDPQNYHYLYNCFSNSACVMNLQSFIRNY